MAEMKTRRFHISPPPGPGSSLRWSQCTLRGFPRALFPAEQLAFKRFHLIALEEASQPTRVFSFLTPASFALLVSNLGRYDVEIL